MDWEAGQGHYPYQAPIDAYGNGGFRFADMSHKGSLISLPSGMYAWDIEEAGAINAETLSRVFDATESIDVLLVGTGADIAPIDRNIRAALRERGVIVEAVATGSAVRTYNVLMNEKRAVGLAVLAVDQARS